VKGFLLQISFILILNSFISVTQAQDSISYPMALLKEQGAIWSSPARIKKKDILPISLIGVSTAVAFSFDWDIHQQTPSLNSNFKTGVDYFTELGSPFTLVALDVVGFTVGKISKNERLTKTSELASLSLINTAIVTVVFKGLTGRERPSETDNPFLFHGPSLEHFSFPSFHAAGSWAMATSIARSYPEKKWIGITCYTLATGVSVSRVLIDKHWTSDVVIGSALGFGIGTLVNRIHENDHFVFFPIFQTYKGVGLSYQF